MHLPSLLAGPPAWSWPGQLSMFELHFIKLATLAYRLCLQFFGVTNELLELFLSPIFISLLCFSLYSYIKVFRLIFNLPPGDIIFKKFTGWNFLSLGFSNSCSCDRLCFNLIFLSQMRNCAGLMLLLALLLFRWVG